MPFGNDLVPSTLHCHPGHQEARAAMAQLVPSHHSVIYLANPAMGARGNYAEIVARLGVELRFFKSALIAQAGDLLVKETTERGRRVVVGDSEGVMPSSRLCRETCQSLVMGGDREEKNSIIRALRERQRAGRLQRCESAWFVTARCAPALVP